MERIEWETENGSGTRDLEPHRASARRSKLLSEQYRGYRQRKSFSASAKQATSQKAMMPTCGAICAKFEP